MLKTLLFSLTLVGSVMAEFPDDRIEFGFVMLPNESFSHVIKEAKYPLCDTTESGGNAPAMMPHVSLGQYGILREELPILGPILKELSKSFQTYITPMQDTLSVTAENIFFDFQAIRENTDPKLVELYKSFRTAYMERSKSKFPIAQALYERLHGDDIDRELIDTHYQNWGTPEHNRIRPHITVIYNYYSGIELL